MRRTGTGRHSPIQPRALLSQPAATGGGGEPAGLDACLACYVSRWEGDGAAPSSIAARAQNSGIEAGDPLEYLTDWSGQGHHLRQTTLAQQPEYNSAGAPDSVAAAYFDGSAWLDSQADATWPSELIVLAVHYQSFAPAVLATLFCVGNPVFSTGGLLCGFRRGSSSYLLYNEESDGSPSIWAIGDFPASPTTYERGYWKATLSAATLEVEADGVDVVTTTTGTTISGGDRTRPIRLGAIPASGSNALTGYLRGLAVLPITATAQQITDVWALLEGTT